MEEKKLETFLGLLIPVKFSYFSKKGVQEYVGKPINEVDKDDTSLVCSHDERTLAVKLKNGMAMEIFTKTVFPIIKGSNDSGLKVGSSSTRVMLKEIESKSVLIDLLNARRCFEDKETRVKSTFEEIKEKATKEADVFLSMLNHATINSPKAGCFESRNGSYENVESLQACYKGYRDSNSVVSGEVIVLETDQNKSLAKEIRTGFELPYLSDFSYCAFERLHDYLDTFYLLSPRKVTQNDLDEYIAMPEINIRKNIMSATDNTIKAARQAAEKDRDSLELYIDNLVGMAFRLEMDNQK